MKEINTDKGATGKPGQTVYFFSAAQTDGNAGMKNVLGGKGANLAEMTSLGLPVPPGFTISTEVCQMFYDGGEKMPEDVRRHVVEALGRVEKMLEKSSAIRRTRCW